MSIEPNSVYTVAELAELLRCSKSNAYALITTGQIASMKVGAGNSGRRILGSDLLAFLEARRTGGPKPRGAIKHLTKWVS